MHDHCQDLIGVAFLLVSQFSAELRKLLSKAIGSIPTLLFCETIGRNAQCNIKRVIINDMFFKISSYTPRHINQCQNKEGHFHVKYIYIYMNE